MIRIALATLLAATQPAQACHHYHFWHFKEPQRCPVTTRVALHAPAAPDKSYFVEITTPPPAPTPPVKTLPIPPIENLADPRTPAEIAQDIADQAEHDAAVADKKDEINNLMIILKAKEAAKAAAGIR